MNNSTCTFRLILISCWQTDASWTEESADNEEEDWLLKQLSSVLQSEHRKVHFDPYLDDTELLKLLDDELYGQTLTQPDLQSRPHEYFDHYVSRLDRFLSNIDYFLESWHYDHQWGRYHVLELTDNQWILRPHRRTRNFKQGRLSTSR